MSFESSGHEDCVHIGEIRAKLRSVDSLLEKTLKNEELLRQHASVAEQRAAQLTQVSGIRDESSCEGETSGRTLALLNDQLELLRDSLDHCSLQVGMLEKFKKELNERLKELEKKSLD